MKREGDFECFFKYNFYTVFAWAACSGESVREPYKNSFPQRDGSQMLTELGATRSVATCNMHHAICTISGHDH